VKKLEKCSFSDKYPDLFLAEDFQPLLAAMYLLAIFVAKARSSKMTFRGRKIGKKSTLNTRL